LGNNDLEKNKRRLDNMEGKVIMQIYAQNKCSQLLILIELKNELLEGEL
jgi:hypothetical protein